MAINDNTKLNSSFKKLFNKAHTQDNFSVAEESISSNISIGISTIISSNVNPNPISDSQLVNYYDNDGVVEKIKFEIEIIPDTKIGENQSQGYRLKLPSGYTENGALNTIFSSGEYLHESLGRLQLIPPLFGELKSDGTTEYDPILYKQDGVSIISKFDPINWSLDYYNGILFIQNPPVGFDVSSNRPGYIDAYLYIGKYLSDIVLFKDGQGTTWNSVESKYDLGGEITSDVNISSSSGHSITIGGNPGDMSKYFGNVYFGSDKTYFYSPYFSIRTKNGTTKLVDIDETNISEFNVKGINFINGNTLRSASFQNFQSFNITSGTTSYSFSNILTQLKNNYWELINNSTTGTTISFNSTGSTGLNYDKDYSNSFIDRSLVDKAYVDNKIVSGTTNSVTGATNGLSLSANTISFGGLLNKDTTLDLNNKIFDIQNTISVFSIGSGFNNPFFTINQDVNSKYIIGGSFTSYSGVTTNRIVRLNQDGTIDNTFNIGTGFSGTIYEINEDLNGKYVIGGSFTSYSGVTANRIIRLNQDGTIDNTFNSGTGFNGVNDSIRTMIIDSNGKYVIGGNFTTYSGTTANYVIRLNQDGTIDNTFNSGTGFNTVPHKIIQDSNGEYVIGGSFTSYSGVTTNRIIRLNQDGTIDNTFNIGTGFNSSVYDIIENNNKYVIGGNFTTYSGTTANYVIRLNQDGTIDNTFNSGTGFSAVVQTIIKNTNNKYLISGSFTSYNDENINRIALLNQDGSLGFNITYKVIYNNAIPEYNDDYSTLFTNRSLVDKAYVDLINTQLNDAVNLQIVSGSTDNEFLVTKGYVDDSIITGTTNSVTGATNGLSLSANTISFGGILNQDTTLDLNNKLFDIKDTINSLNIGSGFNEYVYSITKDSNGRYLTGGDFTAYNGNTANRIIRLNQDGSIDNSFNSGTGFNGTVNCSIQDSNGRYLTGGDFTGYNGSTANYIIRLNQDGSIDNTFNSGTGFNGTITNLLQDSNGKYLTGYYFTTYSGVTTNRIVRLNQDGSIDSTFNIGTGFNATINHIIEDSNNKYLVVGNFSTYSGLTANKIVRLNQDGSIDNTFNIGTGFNEQPSYMIEDTNNKYLITGSFASYSGVTAIRIIRLNQDGSIDNSFNSGTGFNNIVRTIIQDTNNKYLLGGSFTSYSGVTANRIIRLNQDGTIDNTFNIGTGFSGTIYSILENSDSEYIIGGGFTTYSGQSSNYIIGLNQDASISTNLLKLEHINGLPKYNDDYSSRYTDRTLVDKEYVDNKTNNTEQLLITGDTIIQNNNNNFNVFVNAVTGITITMPLPLYNGQTFIIKDTSGNANTNNITINSVIASIDGVSNIIIDSNYGGFTLVGVNDLPNISPNWYITNILP